jgi:hypothetical protein
MEYDNSYYNSTEWLEECQRVERDLEVQTTRIQRFFVAAANHENVENFPHSNER